MMRLFLVFTFTIIGVSAQATVYSQMNEDLQTLESAIQSSIKRIQEKETKIIEKTESKNTGIDLLGYVIGTSSARVTAFRLQGVLRLIVGSLQLKAVDQKNVITLYRNIKSIEDAIGKMDEAQTTLNNAIKKGASTNKIKALRTMADTKSKALATIYADIGWLDSGVAETSIQYLHFLNALSSKNEAKLITSAIINEMASFKMEIEKELLPGLRDQEFSHDSMEYNFHEFRRQIRWVAIYFSSLPSLFMLSPYTTEGLNANQVEILETYKNNKYAQIDSHNSPIVIDRLTFYTLAHYIQIAGDAKDVAEEHFKLIENGIPSELDEKQFKKDMVKMMIDFIDSKTFENLGAAIQ